ncbi:MAG: rhomboid family intramembrane serine protease [Thermoplasmata archaeon]|nr:rhomboid family intramembrane serine protease [Thermoplasmata archaeon]
METILNLPSMISIVVILAILTVAYIKKITLTISLLLANIIVFFIYSIYPVQITLGLAFNTAYLSPAGVPYLYTLLTSMFVHSNFAHLFGNMFVLFFLGMAFERRVGSKIFLLIYVITGVCGAVTFSFIHLNSTIFLVGASGAIFGILGAFAAAYPRDEVVMPIPVGIMLITRVKVITAAILFATLETILSIWSPYISDNTAHLAHIGGLVSGIVLSMLLIRKTKSNDISTDHVDIRTLEKLAKTAEQLEILDRIRYEVIPDVRRLWVEKFLETVRCPRCGGEVYKRGNEIRCRNCSFRIKM